MENEKDIQPIAENTDPVADAQAAQPEAPVTSADTGKGVEPPCQSSVPGNAAALDDGWFDDILGHTTEPQPQLDMDESAHYTPGLTHPADMELERIIEETYTMGPDESAEAPNAAETDQDESPIEEETPVKTKKNSPAPTKRRPGFKKGAGLLGIPHILATAVWLFVALAIGVSLGRLLWVCAADVLAFGKPAKEAIITIYENDSLDDISEKLHEAGLIKYPGLFKMYLEFSGNEELELGVHQLSPMIYDYHAIKTALAPKVSSRDILEVVIPEGYTCAQIFELLEKKGVCTAAKLEEYAASGDLNEYWFLEGVERGDKYCLEGYLFPDTYQFYKDHDPELVLEKMLDNFDYRFTDIMKDKIAVLNERLAATLRGRGYDDDYIKAHEFSIREVVIVASMIERETANGTESYEIASVIYNRLTNPKEYPYLNIDATVIYGMGGSRVDENGKTIPLTRQDLDTDTPYNTYTRKGMIPGPIANPGRNSINAALDPNDSEYYFYVYDPSAGAHRFGRNEEEHEKNKALVKENG